MALLIALLLGGVFDRSRLPDIPATDVSVISAEEFAALTQPDQAPEVSQETPAPEAPLQDDAPEVAVLPDAPEALDRASAPEAPEADAPVEPLAELPDIPDADISDTLPPVEAPPVVDERPEAPLEAIPAPALRVAPEAAPPSPPDIETAPQLVEDTAPVPSPEPPQPIEEATAPEEATTEIVTEAEISTFAPSSAPRPRNRPERTVAAVSASDPAPRDAIAEAVASAVVERDLSESSVPSGPPLSFGEREALRVAVSQCWDVDVGGRSADVTVTVAIDMNRDGTVVGNQVRQVAVSGGDATSQRTAFEKARRAILRCQRGGFPLPVEKYAQWQQIEMTFNPEGMRLR